MYTKRSTITKIIDTFRSKLISMGVHPQRIILFGSHVQGKAKRHSDIDVVVISNDFRNLNLRQRLEVLGIAAVRVNQPIEAKGYTNVELKSASKLNFLGEVLATGVEV